MSAAQMVRGKLGPEVQYLGCSNNPAECLAW